MAQTTAQEPRLLPTAKRVRARIGARIVADSTRARIVVPEGGPPRTYAFPREDVHEARLPEGVAHALGELVALDWHRVDAWYEEDEEVETHPRDPHHRIDVLESTRHVVIKVDGEAVADTRRPVLLFETGLPVRFYVPPLDVDWSLLRPSGKTTGCPYKGHATYHHVQAQGLHRDLAWTYRAPLVEAWKTKDRIAFFNEHVDLFVDGEAQERPRTRWS